RPDAEAISRALKMAGGSLYSNVAVTTLVDSDATVQRIERAFVELSAKVRAEDVFILYLAGHGKTQDGRFYFLPYDFRYTSDASIAQSGIGQDRLQKWLSGIAARKSIVLSDSCESGSLTRGI